jgi:phytoene/squalene synthetase
MRGTLAEDITWKGSKQTYWTIRLLVDRDLQEDCFKAYAYFRWADDVIDVELENRADRVAFMQRQRKLLKGAENGDLPPDLTAEERMLLELVGRARQGNPGLRSYIDHFMAVLEFDARRKGGKIHAQALEAYSAHLAIAVTDGIHYFIGNHQPSPMTEKRYLAVTAAHITHMLRDAKEDARAGYVNVPAGRLDGYIVGTDLPGGPEMSAWIKARVKLAREYFRQGEEYFDGLRMLRLKLAGLWYVSRYDFVLTTIEEDGYRLRESYELHAPISFWLNIAWRTMRVILLHLLGVFSGRSRTAASGFGTVASFDP